MSMTDWTPICYGSVVTTLFIAYLVQADGKAFRVEQQRLTREQAGR
jgi:hypothetical protein